MDRDFLKNKYGDLVEKLGPLGPLIEIAAQSIVIPLREGDIEGAKARAVEGKEFAVAFDNYCDAVLEDLADDQLTAAEFGELLNELATVVDEAEDVVTGVDEDDATAVE